jgi:class 3 adenylate cyclase/predicted ATPase
MECGARLGSTSPTLTPAIVRGEERRDGNSLLRAIAERVKPDERQPRNGTAGGGENRLVTALFADISDFTSLSQRYSAERVVEIVNECFASVSDAVLRYEGTINQFSGDCVLAFFGAPLMHENDPERALLAALAIQAEAEKLAVTLSVGVNSGMVYFGPVGTRSHREVTAYGPDINLAKRLQEAAGQGQILVGESTYRLTRGAFDFQGVNGLVLKGMGESTAAHQLLRARERPEKVRGIDGLRAPMVGRDRELTAVRAAHDRWRAGQGQIVSIIGEAGIGKSRLVAELKAGVRRQASGVSEDDPTGSLTPDAWRLTPLWLEGRCLSIGQPISYRPFLDILRSYFCIGDADSPAESARKVTEGVTALFPHNAGEILPFLGQLLSLRLGDELDGRLQYLTPEQIRQQTLIWLRSFFATLARRQPLLLLLEDLHWADDLSLDLVTLLLESLATAPLMLLCVYRPEREQRAWQLGALAQTKCSGRHTEIVLGNLSGRESRRLVEELLRIEALPESVKELILRKSEGNPFFIEEVLRSLIDRELVSREGGEWRVRDEIAEIDVPDTIQSVVLTRVDRLAPEVKSVLQCAAVIGRLFSHRLLEQLAPPGSRLDEALRELTARELVSAESDAPERAYAFRHALTQEVAYQSMLEKRRREYHHHLAAGMEILYPERLEEYYEEIAHHYSRADAAPKAVEYLFKAGEKAKRRSANAAAISHFRNTLERLPSLPPSAERTQRELIVQISLGAVLQATRGFAAPEVESAYARARALCVEIGETPQLFPALRGLLAFHFVRAEYQTARELGEQLLRLAQRQDDLLPEAHRALGQILPWLGELDTAQEHLDAGITLYDPQRHRSLAFLYGTDMGVVCLSYAAITLWYRGFPDQALERSREAVALARELAHPFSLAYALTFMAWIHLSRREASAAQEWAEALIALATEHGFPFWLALGMLQRGWALADQGRGAKGIAQMRQGLDTYRTTGAELARPTLLAWLAEGYAKANQPEEGLAVLAEALAAAAKSGERLYEAELHRLRGELLLRTAEEGGSPAAAEAERCFRQAIAIARRQGAKSWELRAGTSWSRLLRQEGRPAEAWELLAPICGWFTEGLNTPDLREARALREQLGPGHEPCPRECLHPAPGCGWAPHELIASGAVE